MNRSREAILRTIRSKGHIHSSELARQLSLTRQGVHRYLKELMRAGMILRYGTSKKTSYYVLNSPNVLKKLSKGGRSFQKNYRTKGLSEDRVYDEIQGQLRPSTSLSEEAQKIFQYSLTEMLNNAIDHSKSSKVQVETNITQDLCRFVIRDSGIGVFENIRSKKHLSSEMEAIQDLLKGRQTTAPSQHSGEGIFFTSRSVDRFVLESHKKRLIVDNDLKDFFLEEIHFLKGTRVVCEIRPKTSRKLGDVFQKYTNEEYKFNKTEVRVKLFREGEHYISRSQAKRLLHSLGGFLEIVLDFDGIESIGQGFADEIFRIFQKQHPNIKITPINTHENVLFMIERAKAEQDTHDNRHNT